jgi:hypothetical protein
MQGTTKIFDALRNAEQALAELRGVLEDTNGGANDEVYDRIQTWRRLLTMVDDAGGTVSRDEWWEMGARFGYDPRGLGGFFVGRGTMKSNGDGTHSLTDAGYEFLDKDGRLR